MPIKTAVVLAAGEGTRLRPLTYTRPKLMIPVAGRPFLHHMLSELSEAGLKKAVVVVGYKAEFVKKYLDENAKKIGLKIEYALQETPRGTGHAFSVASEYVSDERFIGLCGDNFYPASDISAFLKRAETEPDFLAGAIEVEEPQRFGIFSVQGERITNVFEKPANPPSNLANTSLYLFDRSIFESARKLVRSPRGEYEITDILRVMAGRNRLKFHKLSYWKDLGKPWDVLDFNQMFLGKLKGKLQGDVSRLAHLEGEVFVGKGTEILPGSYIVGPAWIGENCEIGPNCFIRKDVSLGERTGIGQAVELKNTVVFGRTNIKHLSYIGDSVIGEGCNLAAGTITANLRHDKGNVKMLIRGVTEDTEKKKLGLTMGDNSKTGINTSIYPGKCIGPNSWTDVSSVVERDVPPNHFLKRDGKLLELRVVEQK
jgi:UDP-N-acetylglucosamine diphosphorylase/glucosamine-1-phosphate N-acetyltransferase